MYVDARARYVQFFSSNEPKASDPIEWTMDLCDQDEYCQKTLEFDDSLNPIHHIQSKLLYVEVRDNTDTIIIDSTFGNSIITSGNGIMAFT